MEEAADISKDTKVADMVDKAAVTTKVVDMVRPGVVIHIARQR